MSAVDVGAVVTGRDDGPVVVLSNSLGSTFGMWDAQIAAGVKNARLLVVPRAAHLANAERPDVITPALIKHLEQS